MNHYDNRIRPGVRTTTSISPKQILEDLDETIHTLDPNATPIQAIVNYLGKGSKPVSNKIQVMQYDTFDNFDFCSSSTMGTGNYTRFANLTLDQASRPTTNSLMFYYPQDKLFIVETGQVVEVVMNERAAVSVGGSDFAIPAAITGNTTTRSLAGTVVVRNTEPDPVQDFTTSDVIYLGRTIYESQPIEAESAQRDVIFDCNFVEHKEKVLIFTEDQKKWVKTRGTMPDWDMNQKEMMKEFKTEIDSTLLWGERVVNMDVASRPTRHMRGLYNAIRTNVSVFDPTTVTDFEQLFVNFMYEQAFRYNPNGYRKIALCGGRFLIDFNMAFREYRRTSDLSGIGKSIGLDMETYSLPGQMKLNLVRTELLRQNTALENWCFVIDPSLAKLRLVKDYESRYYSNNNERDTKLMVEWQGTVAWHLEQSHALLKTYRT